MKTFFLKNLPKRLIYKNPEKREAVTAQVESREKAGPNLETEEMDKRERLEKEYEATKARLDTVDEELQRVEGVVAQIPEELGVFAKLKKTRRKFDAAVTAFRKIDMEYVVKRAKEVGERKFNEFCETLESSDLIQKDRYYNSPRSKNEYRKSFGKKPLFDELFALEKDANIILKILEQYHKCDWEGSIEDVESLLKESSSLEFLVTESLSGQVLYDIDRTLDMPATMATILWVLTGQTDKKVFKENDRKLCRDDKLDGSLFSARVGEAANYIDDVNALGVNDPKVILGLWRCSKNPSRAVEIYEFAKKHYFKVFDNLDNTRSILKLPMLSHIYQKCKDNPARIALTMHILEGTARFDIMNFDSFLKDPALPICETVYLKMRVKNPELALKIGRTLYFSGIDINKLDKITPDMIDDFARNIEQIKDSYAEIPIFEDRNVILVANNEKWRTKYRSDARFATDEIIDGIEASYTRSFDIFTPGKNMSAKDLLNFKLKLLYRIRYTPPPLTVVFTGHGNSDDFFYKVGEITGVLSYEEIADALIYRTQVFGRDEVKTDFYTFHSCFGSNFIRKIIEKVRASKKGQLPILAAESEYGQFTFSLGNLSSSDDVNNSVHSVLGVRHPETSNDFMIMFGPAKTIGDFIDNEQGNSYSNPILIVPADNDYPFQIVKSDENDFYEQKNTS